jgi:hypothetical protein
VRRKIAESCPGAAGQGSPRTTATARETSGQAVAYLMTGQRTDSCRHPERYDLQLLTVMVTLGLVPTSPPPSEATLWSVYVPLGALVVFHSVNQP